MKKLLLFLVLLCAGLAVADWTTDIADNAMLKPIVDPLSQNNMNTVDAFFQSFFGTFTQNPDTCDINSAQIAGYETTFTYPAILVGILIMVGVAIMYMAGQFLSSPQMIAMAKDEIGVTGRTLVITAFIILWIYGSYEWLQITTVNSTDPLYAATGGQAPLMIDVGIRYSKFIAYQTMSTLSGLLVYNTFLQTIYSATIYIGVTLKAMFSFNVGPILKPLVDMFAVVIQFLSASLGEWVLHFMILCFIKKWTWMLFIPIGMLLRAAPQTRDAGNAFFGIFFAFAAIYPLMLVANWEIYKLTSFAILDSSTILGAFFNQAGIFGSGIYGIALLLTLGSVIMPFLMGAMINVGFDLMRNAIYYVVIISLLLPFINIFVTLTAAREIARFFGSEINFGSFVKII